MKKYKGEVQQFFIQMICIIFSFAILLYAIYFLTLTITYTNVNQTARQYILKMERKGYLTIDEKKEIEDKVKKNKNVESVNVEINALGDDNKVKYGENVSIEITCTLRTKSVDFLDDLPKSVETSDDFVVTKESTARW